MTEVAADGGLTPGLPTRDDVGQIALQGGRHLPVEVTGQVITREAARRRARDLDTLCGTSAERERWISPFAHAAGTLTALESTDRRSSGLGNCTSTHIPGVRVEVRRPPKPSPPTALKSACHEPFHGELVPT